jgi:ATP-dependent helicase/nuclease subunit A
MHALQQLASNPKNSAWVFASAGSGKTKILTDRVLRLLLEDVACNKILCLTFTKTAAAEMQDRINRELIKWVLCSDGELEKKLNDLSGNFPSTLDLKKARTLLVKILDSESKIKVQTIHSFCQSLIKIFPFESGVKPNFEVLESEKEKLLLKQAQKEVLKKAANNKSLQILISAINSKTYEEGLSNLVSDILSKKEKLILLKENFFGIEGIVDEIFKNFSVEKNCDEQEIFKNFFSKIDQTKVLNLAFELKNTGLINNGKIATAIENFLKNPSIKNFSSYQQAFFTQENEPRKVSKEIASNPTLSAIINEQQELILEFSEKLNSLQICKNTSLLLHFIDQILENYSRLKNQNAFLDYNDLIVETNRLLANPNFSDWVKMKMDGTFDHILIDESQDTNHQQWNIIKALSEDFFSGLSAAKNSRSIFIVGDEKQSIYSFQGAEPNISSEIFAYFENKMAGQLKKIELNNSFRSTKEILQAVDAVFSDEKRKNAISKVSAFKQHQAIRSGVGFVEIWPKVQFEKTEKEEKNYEWKIDFSEDDDKEAAVLARIIALKIQNWVENKRILQAKNRAVQYGDFMILLRNRTNGFAQALNKYFSEYKIPFSSISKIKFDESLIIQDLLAAAKFALLPHDDLNLACLLKSPIFEVSEEDLFEICLYKNNQNAQQVQGDAAIQNITIYESLNHLTKFSAIKKNLDELVVKAQELNCFEFFFFLLEKKNARRKIISYFGEESCELLNKFSLEVFNFYEKFSPNLQKFLDFVEKLNPEISLSHNDENRVKITTIHSAKGLQAPVVMIPDCSYNFNKLLSSKEEISWMNFNENVFPIWCGKKSNENQLLKNHRQKKLDEAKEEYLRLLYVAMTRAEDELYIGGFGNEKDSECWYEVAKNSLPNNLLAEEKFCEDLVVNSENFKTDNKIVIEDFNFYEEESLPTTLQPSEPNQQSNQIDHSQIKGRLIHKIFEIFGKNHREEKNWLAKIASQLVAKENFLDESQKTEVSDQALKFLHSPLFEELFSGKIFCEVELSGSRSISRIDLLIERENEVLIVDYKSDETMPDKIPQQYIDQLKNYENLVKKIYPKKKISCAILWTKFLNLAFVS